MFSDLQVYATPKLQHAQMLLALLQLALKKAGLTYEARCLDGLDLTNKEMAQGALMVLQTMSIPAKGARQAHDMALSGIRAALIDAPVSANN